LEKDLIFFGSELNKECLAPTYLTVENQGSCSF